MSAHVSTQEPDLSPERTELIGADEPAGALPVIVTSAPTSEILDRLTHASRRGRLPGFEASCANGLFQVAAHGHPFDAVLAADHRAAGPSAPARLEFRLRLLPKIPVIFAAVLAFTIWPGVYFMDELLAQLAPGVWSFSVAHWGLWATWYWYLPLTVLPIPWVWASLMRKSRATTHAAAVEAIGKIAGEIGGRVERS